MALPNARSWKAIREKFKKCFSDQTSLSHTAAQLENMTQKPNEPLRLYIFRYSKIHKSVTKQDACSDTDLLNVDVDVEDEINIVRDVRAR